MRGSAFKKMGVGGGGTTVKGEGPQKGKEGGQGGVYVRPGEKGEGGTRVVKAQARPEEGEKEKEEKEIMKTQNFSQGLPAGVQGKRLEK